MTTILGRRPFAAILAAVLATVGFWFSPMVPDAALAGDLVTAEITLRDHKFEPAELKIPAGKDIKITVKNMDGAAEEFDSNDLGVEKIIAGNSTGIVRIKPLKPGTYAFYGEYHADTAIGQVIAE